MTERLLDKPPCTPAFQTDALTKVEMFYKNGVITNHIFWFGVHLAYDLVTEEVYRLYQGNTWWPKEKLQAMATMSGSSCYLVYGHAPTKEERYWHNDTWHFIFGKYPDKPPHRKPGQIVEHYGSSHPYALGAPPQN